jgi:branched-chain amino acid transport system ATP-binding protein
VGTLLETRDIALSFGGLQALDGISVAIEEGEILGMIGPNGSGKTTFINVLTKIYAPERGWIQFRGERIDHHATHQITERGIARTFQNLRIFRNLSVLDNVIIGRHHLIRTNALSIFLRPVHFVREERAARARAMEILELVGLHHKSHEMAKNLPYGEQRRLELARALATEPALLLLDEPTAGMNPRESSDMVHLLKQINSFGKTIFIIEHNMRMVMNVSSRIMVLNAGRTICEGTPVQVQKDERVQEVYLGKEEPGHVEGL